MSEILADTLSKTKVLYSVSFLKLWFDKFNETYFKGELDNNIPLSWENSMDCNGCFCFSVDVFAKKIIPQGIKLKNNSINSFDAFRNVLVHEMLHYYADCYLNKATDSDWMEAIKLKMTKGEEGGEYLDILNLGEKKCHLGEWLRIANQLNAKHKELNITAFGDRDIGLMYNDNKIDYNNIHLVCVRYVNNDTGKENEKYKSYTSEKLKEVIKHIKDYKASKKKSKIEYYFYELELDRDKLAVTGFDESLGSESFTDSFLKYLRNSGVIKKGVIFLGKSDNYRSFSVV